MVEVKFTVVETALGAFGVAWCDTGILRSWMHAGTMARTREQVLRAYPRALEAAPPSPLASVVNDVVDLLAGESRDLLAAELDMSGIEDFDRRVYEFARSIGPGSTITYGEIARGLGEEPMRAKDVGVALARNRFAPFVPCHRVIAAGGKLGGYSAPGGTATKRRLLELEGAPVATERPHQPGLFDQVGAD